MVWGGGWRLRSPDHVYHAASQTQTSSRQLLKPKDRLSDKVKTTWETLSSVQDEFQICNPKAPVLRQIINKVPKGDYRQIQSGSTGTEALRPPHCDLYTIQTTRSLNPDLTLQRLLFCLLDATPPGPALGPTIC